MSWWGNGINYLTLSLREYFPTCPSLNASTAPWCVRGKRTLYILARDFLRQYLLHNSWYEAFHSPTVWHTFVLEDKILVRRKFNLCYGWQDYLDKLRSHFFLQKMGKHMRYLIFSPMSNMNGANMQFQFIHILTTYAIRNPLDHIQHLKFTFSCPVLATSQISDGAVQAHPGLGTSSSVYGTGGDMMTCLKSLMAILPGLTRLELINLMLDSSEALKLLDQVCWTCCGTMHTLNLVNFTKLPCAILHPGVFIKLRSLTISPQNLSADLVWLLGNLSKLRNLYIVHQPVQKNDATAAIGSVDAAVWVQLNRNNPRLRVHLKCSGRFTNLTLVWQNKAPVTTIVYESPYTRVIRVALLLVLPIVARWWGTIFCMLYMVISSHVVTLVMAKSFLVV